MIKPLKYFIYYMVMGLNSKANNARIRQLVKIITKNYPYK